MTVYQAVQDQPVRVLLDAGDTGLTLGSFTIAAFANGTLSATPTADFSLTLVEISAVSLPGIYELRITPAEAGLLSVFLTKDATTYEYVLQVARESIDILGAKMAGAEAAYLVTVEDGVGAALDGVVVRVYDEEGLRLVARGLTNASGQITFYLPVGTYQVKVTKTGYSGSTTEISVEAERTTEPIITQVLPATFSVGDTIAIVGLDLGTDEVVVDFDDVETDPVEISPDGNLLLVVVPTHAAGALELRVGKTYDPEGDYIYSAPFPVVLA